MQSFVQHSDVFVGLLLIHTYRVIILLHRKRRTLEHSKEGIFKLTVPTDPDFGERVPCRKASIAPPVNCERFFVGNRKGVRPNEQTVTLVISLARLRLNTLPDKVKILCRAYPVMIRNGAQYIASIKLFCASLAPGPVRLRRFEQKLCSADLDGKIRSWDSLSRWKQPDVARLTVAGEPGGDIGLAKIPSSIPQCQVSKSRPH